MGSTVWSNGECERVVKRHLEANLSVKCDQNICKNEVERCTKGRSYHRCQMGWTVLQFYVTAKICFEEET